MKKLLKGTSVVFFAVMIAAMPLFAGVTDSNRAKINSAAVESLKNGLRSDNEGLMKSSVYMAGKYKVALVVDELAEILFSETSSANKELVARALYEIGSQDAMNLLRKSATYDDNYKVRKTCSMLVKDLTENEGRLTAYEK